MLESIILIFLTQLIFFCFYLVRILYPLVHKIEFYPVIGQQPLTMVQRFDLVVAHFIHYVQYNLFDSFSCCLLGQSLVFLITHCCSRIRGLCYMGTVVGAVVSKDVQFAEIVSNLSSEQPEYYVNMYSPEARKVIAAYTVWDKIDPDKLYVSNAVYERNMLLKSGVTRIEYIGDTSQFYRVLGFDAKANVVATNMDEGSSTFQHPKLVQAITDHAEKPHNSYVVEYKSNGKESFGSYQMSALTATGVPKGTQPFAEAFANHNSTQYSEAGNMKMENLKSIHPDKITSVHAVTKLSEITPQRIARAQQNACASLEALQDRISEIYARQGTSKGLRRALCKAIVENKELLQILNLFPEKLGVVPDLSRLEEVAYKISRLDRFSCEAKVFSALTQIPQVPCDSFDKVQLAVYEASKIPSSSPIQDFNTPHDLKFRQKRVGQSLVVTNALDLLHDSWTFEKIGKKALLRIK